MSNKSQSPSSKKECFVIAPIGSAGSEVRKKSDQVFKHIIQKTLEPLQYKAVRADHIAEPGMITSQIIQRINDAPLVIADLSGHNPNVFYELAVRHAANKPVIQLITKGEQIPFDVSGSRTIYYDMNDLDTVDAAKDELAKEILAIESKQVTVDNPINMALSMKLLKESSNPEQRSIAEVMEALSDLRSEVRQIRNIQSHSQSLEIDQAMINARRQQALSNITALEWHRAQKLRKLSELNNVLLNSQQLTTRKKLENEIEDLKQEISDIEHNTKELSSR